ncbi:Hypothetical predicted protein, partial [Olea europaea subsp. europaea]
MFGSWTLDWRRTREARPANTGWLVGPGRPGCSWPGSLVGNLWGTYALVSSGLHTGNERNGSNSSGPRVAPARPAPHTVSEACPLHNGSKYAQKNGKFWEYISTEDDRLSVAGTENFICRF